jgi:hypothetical protein
MLVNLYNKVSVKEKQLGENLMKLLVNCKKDFTWNDVKFYLTGSKYFGGETDSSDKDFFVSYSPELKQTFLDLGFVEIYAPDSDTNCTSEYNDFTLECVLRGGPSFNPNYPYSRSSSNIDIQMVNMLEVRLAARSLLKGLEIDWGCISKEARSYLWKMVMSALLCPSPLDDKIKSLVNS